MFVYLYCTADLGSFLFFQGDLMLFFRWREKVEEGYCASLGVKPSESVAIARRRFFSFFFVSFTQCTIILER